jgi:hypothetical protein
MSNVEKRLDNNICREAMTIWENEVRRKLVTISNHHNDVIAGIIGGNSANICQA